jgi:hypothetical protein
MPLHLTAPGPLARARQHFADARDGPQPVAMPQE